MTRTRLAAMAAALAAAALLVAGCSSAAPAGPPPATSAPVPTQGPAPISTAAPAAGDSGGITPSTTRAAGDSAGITPSSAPQGDSAGITGSTTPAPSAQTQTATKPAPAETPTTTIPSSAPAAAAPTSAAPVAAAPNGGGAPWWPGLPGPPRLEPAAADFASPEAAARAYLAAWCYLPLDGPANQNIANAAAWVSAAGFADDKTRAIGATTWQQIQADGTTTVCGPVHAEDANEGPETDRRRFIGITATRYRIDPAGQVLSSDHIGRIRRVLRADDGRWLVDTEMNAG